jgi:hypothetical protein
MLTYLQLFFEFFRFIKHARERAERRLQFEAEERAAERAHQRAMLETIFTKMVEGQRTQADSILALADSQKATAGVMQTWLDGFRISDPTPQAPTVASDAQAWVKEQLDLGSLGLGDIESGELPPEFELAFQLAKREREASGPDFDREGSDF